MTSIKLIVTGAVARAEVDGPLTTGMVGIPVTIEYDSSWDGLTKNLVCKSCAGTRAVITVGNSATVPHEVMAEMPNADYINKLSIGVEGRNADGTLVIPTIWANCGRIFPGVNSDVDSSTDPTPPVWAQVQALIGDLGLLDTEAKENLVAAINEALATGSMVDETAVQRIVEDYVTAHPPASGEDGIDGASAYEIAVANGYEGSETEWLESLRGNNGGYYIPAVSQPEAGTVQFDFTPSKADMPAVEPVQVSIPNSSDEDSEVPAYWTEYLEGKLQTIRDKIVAGGANSDCFMYFTDHHTGCVNNLDNANNTRHIIDFVRAHTSIQKAFHGGDVLSNTASQTYEHAMNWLWKFHDDYIHGRDVYPVIGNHEISTQYDTSGNCITFDEAYSTLFRDVEKTADTGKKLYYFVDNPSQKIRYIVLDTESETISGNTAQLQWFIDTLATLSEGWTAVMFAHNFSDVTAYDNPINPIITQIAGAYNNRKSGSAEKVSWNYTTAKGTVACLICGHIHRDGAGVNNGILVINVASDCGANVDNKIYEERQAGDVSEQAVELFFINTENRTIETIRLGYGEDRAWTYDSGSEAVVVNLLENADVVLGGPGIINEDKLLNYYYENGFVQATLNPMCLYVEAGGILNVSLSDYSNYQYAVRRYTCDESAKDADFSFTEGTVKIFDVEGEQAYDSGWQESDLSVEIDEPGVLAFVFRNIDYTTLSAEDTAAIQGLLTVTVTYSS